MKLVINLKLGHIKQTEIIFENLYWRDDPLK